MTAADNTKDCKDFSKQNAKKLKIAMAELHLWNSDQQSVSLLVAPV